MPGVVLNGEIHSSAVTEIQLLVVHWFMPSLAVGVVSICAKFIPTTVTLVRPDVAALL